MSSTTESITERRKRISEKILGFDAGTAGISRFIVTNIKPLFDAVAQAGSVEQDYWGFYHSVDIKLGDKHYVMTLLTPGNVIIDVLKLIADTATSVTLLGLCGSLNPRYPVTSVVIPQYVTESAEPSNWTTLNTNCQTGLCTCQVDGLVQTESFYRQLANIGIDFVDMESFFLKKHLPYVSTQTISVVSDMPLISPFYEEQPFDIDIEAILQYL